MRLLAAAVTVAGASAGLWAFNPTPQEHVRAVRGFERFQQWARLVHVHTPGELDDAARALNMWPQADLTAVKADLWALGTLTNLEVNGGMLQYTGFNQVIRPTMMGRPASPPRSMKFDDVPDLIGVRDLETGRLDTAAVTRFMKRAALLHTDVAMLAPASLGAPAPPTRADMASPTRRVVDGEDAGWDARPIHWEISRTALEAVRPSPTGDATAAAWYRATSAYLTFRREYGYLKPHLERARTLFPKDARFHLYSGVRHEAYAAPLVQAAVEALNTRGFRSDVKPVADELKTAEAFFRRALELDQGLVAARVRLGRVVGLLGRRDQALRELRLALSVLTDGRERYFAELFLGAEEQGAGRVEAARAAYERASVLYPNAQAPRLALGQLAWHAGDRAGANAAFAALAGLPGDPERREDPWWTYEVSTVLDVALLFERLREAGVK